MRLVAVGDGAVGFFSEMLLVRQFHPNPKRDTIKPRHSSLNPILELGKLRQEDDHEF